MAGKAASAARAEVLCVAAAGSATAFVTTQGLFTCGGGIEHQELAFITTPSGIVTQGLCRLSERRFHLLRCHECDRGPLSLFALGRLPPPPAPPLDVRMPLWSKGAFPLGQTLLPNFLRIHFGGRAGGRSCAIHAWVITACTSFQSRSPWRWKTWASYHQAYLYHQARSQRRSAFCAV